MATLLVAHDLPGGGVAELRVEAPADRTVGSVAKKLERLLARGAAAPAAPLALYRGRTALDAAATIGDAVGPGLTRVRAVAASGAARPRPEPAEAPPPRKSAAAAAPLRPMLAGACVVVASRGCVLRVGRSIETAAAGEIAAGAVVAVFDDDGARCRVDAAGALAGFGSSKCFAALDDAGDPACALFGRCLAARPTAEADVWVRLDRAERRAVCVVARDRSAGPAGWVARLDGGDAAPLGRLEPVRVDGARGGGGAGPRAAAAEGPWAAALRLAADAAAAPAAPDARASRIWAARGRHAAGRGAPHAAALALSFALAAAPQSHGARAPLHRARAAAWWRGRSAGAKQTGAERGAAPAFEMVLGLLAVRDAQFFKRLAPPGAAPPSGADATDAELEAIALFAKVARCPNMLLWPP